MNDRLYLFAHALQGCIAFGDSLNVAIERAMWATDHGLAKLAATPPPAAVAHPASPSNGDGAAVTAAKEGAARARAIREKVEGQR